MRCFPGSDTVNTKHVHVKLSRSSTLPSIARCKICLSMAVHASTVFLHPCHDYVCSPLLGEEGECEQCEQKHSDTFPCDSAMISTIHAIQRESCAFSRCTLPTTTPLPTSIYGAASRIKSVCLNIECATFCCAQIRNRQCLIR